MNTHVYSILPLVFSFFFLNDTATTEIYTLSLHDALPICLRFYHASSPLFGVRPRDDDFDVTPRTQRRIDRGEQCRVWRSLRAIDGGRHKFGYGDSAFSDGAWIEPSAGKSRSLVPMAPVDRRGLSHLSGHFPMVCRT